MDVRQLNTEQLNQLKEAYLIETANESPSLGELLEAHNLPDAVIFDYYAGVEFVPEDFWN